MLQFSGVRLSDRVVTSIIQVKPLDMTGLAPEIKFGSSTRLRQVTALTRFVREHQLPFGMVINQSSEARLLSDHIIQIPAGVL